MSAELNHAIVWCSDRHASSAFLAEMLGCDAPSPFMHFMVVTLANGVSLDFMEKDGPVSPQHYAFLVSEEEFDAVLARIRDRGLEHWADPARSRPGEINRLSGGRGVYFPDPHGHLLEAITRPYSAGTPDDAA
ncbi:VOC family protein [Tsuneonella sp. CC-YZS046]|uniref:VOC family protein n=1 Tax=Tsuneonella sp. CC-YZS046 TaxID=3042152 RepID=UPI002D77488E|nr:VOC family protein [Tsuneonella sp. CC-YZS046]WRO65160.1 VOC family protein [Tsuneonella sp. CC-YZS046]